MLLKKDNRVIRVLKEQGKKRLVIDCTRKSMPEWVEEQTLSRRIYKAYKVEIKELEMLKSIYLLVMGKEKVISKITTEQQELLDRIGLKLEVD